MRHVQGLTKATALCRAWQFDPVHLLARRGIENMYEPSGIHTLRPIAVDASDGDVAFVHGKRPPEQAARRFGDEARRHVRLIDGEQNLPSLGTENPGRAGVVIRKGHSRENTVAEQNRRHLTEELR